MICEYSPFILSLICIYVLTVFLGYLCFQFFYLVCWEFVIILVGVYFITYSLCFPWTCVELCQILFASPLNDSVTDISTHCLVKFSFEFSVTALRFTVFNNLLEPTADVN